MKFSEKYCDFVARCL